MPQQSNLEALTNDVERPNLKFELTSDLY